MTSQQNIFVFIDEDQQKKYSKSTLSAINAQVAKYAHKNRQYFPKSRPVRKSPPPSNTSDVTEPCLQTVDLERGAEGPFKPISSTSRFRKSDSDTDSPAGIYKTSRQNITGRVLSDELKGEDPNLVNTKPEDFGRLFDRLCRVTKSPIFQGFPFFLNFEERRLTHYWFTEIIQEDFGMSKAQWENSFQSCLVKYPLSYQVPLRWMIAHSAKRLHDKTGSCSLAGVYRNQQEAFRKLQGVLLDPTASIDEIVTSLHQTIVHDPESRKLHLRGADAIIQARGGLERVIEQCRLIQPDHLFLQYTFAPFDIDSYEDLELLQRQFFEALRATQEAAEQFAKMKSETENHTLDENLSGSDPIDREHCMNRQYVKQRGHLFGCDTTVGQLVRREFDQNATLVIKSRLFAALFYLGATLLEYETVEEKLDFFRQLEKSANVLSPVCVDRLTGSQRIMPGTFIFMVAHVDRQLREQHNETDEAHKKGMKAAISGIAALKIYGLFSDSMRERLHSYLQNWILGKGNAYLKESDIDVLCGVITQLWLQQKRKRSPRQQSFDRSGGKRHASIEFDNVLDNSNQTAFVGAALA